MIADRGALTAFALRVLGIALGLLILVSVAGFAVKTWTPGFDVGALQWIAAHRSATLTSIVGIVSYAGSLYLLIPLTIVLLLLQRWKRPAEEFTLIVILAGSAALPSLIKLIVHRPRPTIEHVGEVNSLSFPSEHTTQAAAFYLTIAILFWPTLGRGARTALVVLAAVIALIVAGSRLYLGVHYPTDVAAALLLGWSWALLVLTNASSVLTPSPALPKRARETTTEGGG